MIRRFAWEDDQVIFSSRFVATRAREAERRAGRPLFRGLGTPAPGGSASNALRVRFRNAANTGLLACGSELLALWEGGAPHRVDARTLETRGASDLDGVLRNHSLERWIVGDHPLAAHTRRDPSSGVTYGFGLSRGIQTRLRVFALDPAARQVRDVPLPGLPFVHDFALTKRYFVFLLPAVRFDLARTLAGTLSPLDALSSKPGAPMQALLIPRDGGDVRWIDAGSGFAFHIAQAFDDGEEVVVDVFLSERVMNIADEASLFGVQAKEVAARPVRLRLSTGGRPSTAHRLSPHLGELPNTAPGDGARRFIYYASAPRERQSPFLSGVARLDTERRETRVLELYPWIVGEPIVVPRGIREEDAWLLVVRTWPERDRAELMLIDGQTLDIQACWALPHALPPDFHGVWSAPD